MGDKNVRGPFVPVLIFVEGNQYGAVYHDFENLHESPAGFGDTPARAVAGLIVEDSGCRFWELERLRKDGR